MQEYVLYQYEGTYGDPGSWIEKRMIVTINDKVLEGLLVIFLYVSMNVINNVLNCVWTRLIAYLCLLFDVHLPLGD
jgi:hypothetical protein